MIILLLLISGAACQSNSVPSAGSEAYSEAVTAFYTGVTAIQVGENFRAESQLEKAAELAPGEPAIWANRGLLELRKNELDTAQVYLNRARELASGSSQIYFLSGLLAREQGQYEQALSYLREATELDSTNRPARYFTAQVLEQQGGSAASEEALHAMLELLDREPDNLAVLVECARLAAKAGDSQRRTEVLNRIAERASDWPAAVQNSLRSARQAPSEEASSVVFLKNALQRLSEYRTDLQSVQPPGTQIGSVVSNLLRMDEPISGPASPDRGLDFPADTLTTDERWSAVRHVTIAEGAPPDVMMFNRDKIRIETGLGRVLTMPFPGRKSGSPPGAHAVISLDVNYDFRMDLLAAGRGGVRLYQQAADSSFQDVSTEALPTSIRAGTFTGAWTADLDLDGDLDVILARPEGSPITLRNRGDGTFEKRSYFTGIQALRDFVWADIDADGPPEAALLDADGQLHVFDNERSATPRFQRMSIPSFETPGQALEVGDVDHNAQVDLLLLQEGGEVRRLTPDQDFSKWSTDVLFKWEAIPDDPGVGTTHLLTGDLDNNGGIDVLAASSEGSKAWLRDSTATFVPLSTKIEVPVFSIADVRGEGRLDLMARGPDGRALRLQNQGVKKYQSQRLQPRAARANGDRRINPFGIGGEIELRSGLLYQKRVIDDPTVHFGIGRRSGAEVARIRWPNGTVQAEFDLVSTQVARARQRLKGSCPWVYTYDGDGFQFETDFLWRTALGLRINAQGKAQVIHEEDRVFIPGEHLAERNGRYDVRITGELWESHFFDRVELLAVDHPTGTEVRIDERFHLPAPDQNVVPIGGLNPVAHAYDQDGRDVTELIRRKDGQYLDTFELGPFQGRAEEHTVTIDLGDDVPTQGPLWLVADGWVYPTDTSINLAISQGSHAPPRGLTLEVPDGNGGWRVVRSDVGFPAGKSKTMLLDLSDVVEPEGPRRVRLRTNMEIYWDRLAWAQGRPKQDIRTHRLTPTSAELRGRGFSEVVQTERRKPTVPVYDSLMSTVPIWPDLEGYHTRFGDVRELVTETDDRYVIMNAGDEMRLRFDPPSPPPEGWSRDFVLIGDGWVKDGDYNTGYSKTVRPLPYHGMGDYSTPPKPLEKDPAYRKHPEDWDKYHTRYVTPEVFHRSLTVQKGRSSSQ